MPGAIPARHLVIEIADFHNKIGRFQTLAMDQDFSGFVAPLGTRITSWTNCVKVRALVVAVRPAGNTAQRSIRGNAQCCKAT